MAQDGRPLTCLPQTDVNLMSPPLAPVCTATLPAGTQVPSHFKAGPFAIDLAYAQETRKFRLAFSVTVAF